MNTPIYDFLINYSKSDTVRLHMPGHKGKGFLCEDLDITEIKGADELFDAEGIIAKSENNASSLFGSRKTLFSTQGSTLCIQTMISLVTTGLHDNNEKPLIVATRNAHKAFLNSCILFYCDVKWVYSCSDTQSITENYFSSEDIEKAIENCNRKPCAVYITSPDYLGNITDIKSIAKICHLHSIPLLVDNAHGSYLKFLENDIHPITLGADMCCDSAHKTLPCLTSSAYLHISNNAPYEYSNNAKDSMAMLSSTSPSYLTLCSLDLCNRYLAENIHNEFKAVLPLVADLKEELINKGYTLCGSEPLKLTINSSKCGIYGYTLAEALRKDNIECEYSDDTHIVFMFSGKTSTEDIKRLKSSLMNIDISLQPLDTPYICLENSIQKMSIRNAGLSRCETLPTEDCIDRICAKPVITCPPGVPVCVSGELITADTVKILKRYGIKAVNVIK